MQTSGTMRLCTDPQISVRGRCERCELGNRPAPQPSSTGFLMLRVPLAATLPRCQPRASRRPWAGSRTRCRSPGRWLWSSFPTPGTRATGPVPGPPTRSTESAAGPRKPNRPLREDRQTGRFFASLSPSGSATQSGTATESAHRNQFQERRSRVPGVGHIGSAKFGLAGRQHKYAGIPGSHPKIAVTSLRITITAESGSPLSTPKTRVKSSSLRQSLRPHPYQRMSPSTRTASTLGPEVAGAWGNAAHGKSILSGLGIEFLQTRFGAEESVSLSIRLNALCPTDRLERDWKLFKAVAVQVVEPKASTGQQRTVRSFAKCGSRGDRNSLRRSKSPRNDRRRSGRCRFPCSPKRSLRGLRRFAAPQGLSAHRRSRRRGNCTPGQKEPLPRAAGRPASARFLGSPQTDNIFYLVQSLSLIPHRTELK